MRQPKTVIDKTSKRVKHARFILKKQDGTMHRWLRSIGLLIVLCLASCSQQVTPIFTEKAPHAWFTNVDLDHALIDTVQANAIVASEGVETGEVTNHAPLAGNPEAASGLETQAVIGRSSGFVYFIQKLILATGTRYQIIRQDQSTGISILFLQTFNREITSVAGTADGNTVLASIKETSSASSDVEIYKLVRSGTTTTTTKLTATTIDESNVAISGDGRRLVWQGLNPSNNKQAVFLRTLNPNGSLQTQGFLVSASDEYEPSISSNGKFLTFVRDVFGSDQVRRFEVDTSISIGVVLSTVVTLRNPSISDDGTKVAYLEQGGSVLASTIRIKTVGGSNQIILSEIGLEHPHLTRDGGYITFTRTLGNVQNVFTRHLSTNTQVQTSTATSDTDAYASYWQRLAPFVFELKMTASDGQSSDGFGTSIDIDGDILVVGTPLAGSTNLGGVYVYERNLGGPNNWGFRKKLLGSDVIGNDEFGFSVAISGNTVVVGAPHKHNFTGAIYIFSRNQGGKNNWGQVQKRMASDDATDDEFGRSVEISGDTLVVGASLHDDLAEGAGAAYIFQQNQGGTNNWGEVKKLLASDGAGSDFFGSDVAISGNTIVVGAKSDLNTNGTQAGAIYIFERNQGGSNNWGEVIKRISSDGNTNDQVGSSVAIDGSVVIAGSSADGGGAVYLFERNHGGTNNWGQVKKIVSSDLADGDSFGSTKNVAIDGDRLVVGASRHNGFKGAAYIFERNQGGSNNWGELKKLAISNTGNLGSSVTVQGDTIVVGARGDDEAAINAGAAFVFE
jgi:hypothetical protein